jgi:hypothetical protein
VLVAATSGKLNPAARNGNELQILFFLLATTTMLYLMNKMLRAM